MGKLFRDLRIFSSRLTSSFYLPFIFNLSTDSFNIEYGFPKPRAIFPTSANSGVLYIVDDAANSPRVTYKMEHIVIQWRKEGGKKVGSQWGQFARCSCSPLLGSRDLSYFKISLIMQDIVNGEISRSKTVIRCYKMEQFNKAFLPIN